jgi:hypothetical protein
MADAAQTGEVQEFNDKAIGLYAKAIAFGVEKSAERTRRLKNGHYTFPERRRF